MANPTGINQYTKGKGGSGLPSFKGNHRPGWMLRADPKLAAKIKKAKSAFKPPRAR